MSVRVFTVDEANRLLPEVEGELRWFQDSVRQIVATQDAISVREMLGGDRPGSPEHRELSHLRAQLDEAAEQYNARLESFTRYGCVIKNLEVGLVDFYGRKDGRLVFLCWRMGEPSVRYWHEIDGGFGGRRPVEEL